jgi:Zn-dependent metalloprotease
MDDYKTMFEDNGGVHIYSGMPNKAFYLVCVAFGGYSWEKAGKIWWKTMNSRNIHPKCDFKQFAQTTIEVAKELDDKKAVSTVRKAWHDVGVLDTARESDEGCVIL